MFDFTEIVSFKAANISLFDFRDKIGAELCYILKYLYYCSTFVIVYIPFL